MHLDQMVWLRLVVKPKPCGNFVLPWPVFVGRLCGKYLKVWFDLTTLSLGAKNSQLRAWAGPGSKVGLGSRPGQAFLIDLVVRRVQACTVQTQLKV